MAYIRRHIEPVVLKAAKSYPVVTLTGPRQSGKTTLVRNLFDKADYVSLENPDDRAFALEDPRGFLRRFEKRVILDEVQRAPDLLSYIQGIVDDAGRPGQFILTGSQNLLLLEKVGQTLAGRSSILHLLPLSRSEILGRPPIDPSRVARPKPDSRRKDGEEGSLFETLWRGFYPRLFETEVDPADWLRNYDRTYIERDVREVLKVGDLETFNRFVRLSAGRTGQLVNFSSLASDCGVSHDTARRWLSVLESSFLIHLLRPHHRNFNKRLIKSPKLYFLDTGLLCHYLRIRSPEDLAMHSARGAVFESYVVSEMLKSFLNRGRDPDLYFWRDSVGHEIDLLLEKGEELLPIEIKSGETIAGDFFDGLDLWRKMTGNPDHPGMLVYGGDESYERRGYRVQSWRDWS